MVVSNVANSDINIGEISESIEESIVDNLVILTSKRDMIYCNYGMNSYSNIVKLSLLDPSKKMNELRGYKYGKHKDLMKALSNSKLQIVLFGGEKFVSNRHTLIGLIAREVKIPQHIANIPIGTMTSNVENEDSLKYNTTFENRVPNLKDTTEIAKIYNENPSKYNLYGMLTLCIEKFRYNSTIFSADHYEQYKTLFESTNDSLRRELKEIALKYHKTNIVRYIDNIDKLNLISKNTLDEISELSYEDAHKVRNLALRTRDKDQIAEYRVDEQFKNNSSSKILVKDNLLRYNGWEDIVAERYRLVQLEMIFSEPGISYQDFLEKNGISPSKLKCRTPEEANSTAAKISKIVFNSNTLAINNNMAIRCKEQFTELAYNLAENNMYIVYTDDFKIWIMCKKDKDIDDTVKIISDLLKATYIQTVVYRMHICDNCICRKQFLGYWDDNTIQLK